MATDTIHEIEAFYQFLGQQLEQGAMNLSLEQSVQAFRAYQSDLERLRKHLQPSIDRADRGEPAALFDADDVKSRGRDRLAREGITD